MRKKEYLEPKISQQRFPVSVAGGNGVVLVLGEFENLYGFSTGVVGVVVVLTFFYLVDLIRKECFIELFLSCVDP